MKEYCAMKGFLSFIILKLISMKGMSGEEIRSELARRKGSRPSSGTIYPAIKYLSENKLIEEIKGDGKEKKYKITKKGEKEVKAATKKFVGIFCDMKEEFNKLSKTTSQ